jgi:uncharacterized membrane protein (UPF0182 family)
LAFNANLGGKPSGQPLIWNGKGVHKIIIFLCLLAGSFNWIAYRASFTSDLNGIANSNFKYDLSFFKRLQLLDLKVYILTNY